MASRAYASKAGSDVRNDGRLDLLCHFDNQTASFELGDLEGVVMGGSANGRMF